MQVTIDILTRATGKAANDNMRSVVASLMRFGPAVGLNLPHRLAHFLAQLSHESGAFRYDREIWGPTAQQLKYERDFSAAWPPTKSDQRNKVAFQLGNSEKGDGRRFSGKGPIQNTGRGNTTRFYNWCKTQGFNPPDFVSSPDLINSDPWEGLVAIWYWSVGNPTGKSLNAAADSNDIETITKRINGGLNGFADRVNWYVKFALVLLGYAPSNIKGFQHDAQKAGLLPPGPDQIDGDAGAKTRAALHLTMAGQGKATAQVQAAPVVEEIETAVTPKGAENTGVQRIGGALGILSPFLAWIGSLFVGLNQTGVFILLGLGVLGVVILLWRGELIAARARAIIKSFEGSTA